MKKFITIFDCGRIELSLARSEVYFVVTKLQDITDKVIPFFDKSTIKGVKASDYADFKKVAVLITKKDHLSEEGINKIKLIKSNMNFHAKERREILFNKSILNVIFCIISHKDGLNRLVRCGLK